MLSLGNKLTLNSAKPIYHFVNKYSIDFDGLEEVIVTDGADTVLQPTTYSFWCKSTVTSQNQGVFGHGGRQVGAFHINWLTDNVPLLNLGNNYYKIWADNSAQDDGEWHHWVVYLNPDITKCQLYIDAVLQTAISTVSSGSANAYTESLNIGGAQSSGVGDYYEGKIDEFAVYDRELTQDEITRMYNTYYSPNRVANGNFSQVGNEEVTNGDFSQIGSEEVNYPSDVSSITDPWIYDSSISKYKYIDSGSGTGRINFGTPFAVVVGEIYKVEIDITISSGNANMQLASGNSQTKIFSYRDLVNGLNTFYTTVSGVDGNISRIFVSASNTDNDFTLNSISVKEVLQDWTVSDYGSIAASASLSLDNGAVKILKTANSDWRSSFLRQTITYTIGSQYKVTFKIKDGNLTSPNIYLRNNFDTSANTIKASVPITSSFVEHTYYFTADVNSTDISIGNVEWNNFGSGQFFFVDDFTVKEVGQHWGVSGTDSTHYVEFTGSGAKFVAGTTSPVTSLFQNVLVSGRTYRLNCNIAYEAGSGALRCNIGGVNQTGFTEGFNTRNQVAGSNAFSFLRDAANVNCTISNVVIQELKHDATNLMLNSGAYQSANPLITSTKSMEFDGSDDYLNAGVLPDVFRNAFTLSAWVWTDGFNFGQILSTNQGAFCQVYQSGTGLRLAILGGSQYTAVIDADYFDTAHQNTWLYLALVYNGSTIKAYRDGTEVGSAALSGTLNSTTNEANIGRYHGNAEYWNGKITELGLYDRGLTSLEVVSLYNQGMPTNLLVNRNNYQSGNPTVFNTKQVDFDGTDDFLNAGNVLNLGTSDFSISMWVNSSQTTNRIMGKTQDDANRWYIRSTGNKVQFHSKSGGSVTMNLTTTETFPVDTWAHLLISADRDGTVYIYINGVRSAVTAAGSATSLDNTGDLTIGKVTFFDSYFDGDMSQVGIWNKALTADEVSSLYNHGLPIDLKTDQAAYASSSNLVGYWRMGSGVNDAYPIIFDQLDTTQTEIITNGSFATNSNWNAGNWTYIGNGFKIVGASGVNSPLIQVIPVINGKTYTFSYTRNYISGGGVTNVFVRTDGSNYVTLGNYNSTVVEEHTVTGTFVAGFTGNMNWQIYGIGTFTGTVTNASVKLLGGNPAIMSNTFAATAIENGSPYANIVQNSDFSEGTTDWTSGTAVTSFTVTNSIATVLGTASSAQNKIQQSIPVTIGNTYKISGSIRSNDTKDYRIRILDSAYVDIKNNNNSSFETFEYERVAQSSSILLIFESWYSDGTANFSVDYATIEEVNTGLQGYWKMGDGTNDEFPVIYDQTNPTLGSELVTNGDFSNGLTGWTKGTASSSTMTLNSNNQMVMTESGLSGVYLGAFTSINLIEGKTYKFQLDVVSVDVQSQIRIGTASSINQASYSNILYTSTNPLLNNPPTTKVVLFTASSAQASDSYLYIGGRDDVNSLTVDNISIKEIGGNPATMTNMVEGSITNQYPLTKIRNYYRMGDGILDGFPIIQDQTSPNLAHIPTTNLIPFSEDFNGTVGSFSYSKVGSTTVTPNSIIAPDGTNTGTLVTQGTNTLVLRANNVVETNKTYTFSCYVKSSGSGITSVSIDISDESISSVTLTNDWQRISVTSEVTRTPQSTYNFVDISTNGSQNDTFYTWGWQVEEQNQATAYIKSDGIAAVRKATTTNLFLYSEDFSQSFWTKSSVTLTTGFVSPDGTNNAYKLVSTGADGLMHNNYTVSSGTTYTISVYLKTVSGTLDTTLSLGSPGFPQNVGAGGRYKNITVTNQWKRYSLTSTADASAVSGMGFGGFSGFSTGEEVLIWGMQLEEQTQAETYAKTTGLPVTIDLFTENNYGTMTNMSASDIVEDTPNN